MLETEQLDYASLSSELPISLQHPFTVQYQEELSARFCFY